MGQSDFVLAKLDNTMDVGDQMEMLGDPTAKVYILDTEPGFVVADLTAIDAGATVMKEWARLDPLHGGKVGLWAVISSSATFLADANAAGKVNEAIANQSVYPTNESVGGRASLSEAMVTGNSWSRVPDSTQLNPDEALWHQKAIKWDEVSDLATGSGQKIGLIDLGVPNKLVYKGAVLESKGKYPSFPFPQIEDPLAVASGSAFIPPSNGDELVVEIYKPSDATTWTSTVTFDGTETSVALVAAKMEAQFVTDSGGDGASIGAYAAAIENDTFLTFFAGNPTTTEWVIVGSNLGVGEEATTVTIKSNGQTGATLFDDLGFEDGQVGEWNDLVGNYNGTFVPVIRLKYMKPIFQHEAFGLNAFDVVKSVGFQVPLPFPTQINAAAGFLPAGLRADGRGFNGNEFELVDSGTPTVTVPFFGTVPRATALNLFYPGIEEGESIIQILAGADAGSYLVEKINYTTPGKTNLPESMTVSKVGNPLWAGWSGDPVTGLNFRVGDSALFSGDKANSRTWKMATMDAYGHATQMASVINGQHGLGLAPDAQIISYNHTFFLNFFLSSLEKALADGVNVVVTTFPFTRSFSGLPGFEGVGRIIRKAFQQLHKAGVPVYVVAGNQSKFVGDPAGEHPRGEDKPLSLSGAGVFGLSALGPLAYDPDIPNNPDPAANLNLYAFYSSYGVYTDASGPGGNLDLNNPAKPVLSQWFNMITAASQRRIGNLSKSEAEAKGHIDYPIAPFMGTSPTSAIYAGVAAMATEVLSAEDKNNSAQVLSGIIRGKGTIDGVAPDDAPGKDERRGHGLLDAMVVMNKVSGIKD